MAGTCSDGDVSALLSLLPTPGASCLPDNGTECSPSSPCGTMCEPSTVDLGGDTLTSSAEGSPVRTSASPERETDLTGNEADCGPKWPGSLARYNPGSRSWRTAQCSLLGGLTEYSGTFPRWGCLRFGELWELPTPVRRIEGKGSGSWPTPNAAPLSNDLNLQCSGDGRTKPNKLGWAVAANTPSGNWPTPTCSDAFTDKLKSAQQVEGSMHSVNLSQAVRMWPTPSRIDGDFSGMKMETCRARPGTKQVTLATEVQAANGGQLNPLFVSWLMGWPLCWDDLTPLPMETFCAWQQAFQNEQSGSSHLGTVKCLPLLSSHGIPSTQESNNVNELSTNQQPRT